jgi:hypothetical protein
MLRALELGVVPGLGRGEGTLVEVVEPVVVTLSRRRLLRWRLWRSRRVRRCR